MEEIAKQLQLGVIEITSENAKTSGILAEAFSILSEKSIRQSIVDDYKLSPELKLILIVEKKF